jgi:hypothetical protein
LNDATRADRSAASTVAFLLSVSTNVLAAAARQSLRILLWQALRGQSLVQPDVYTIAVFIGWVILSAIGVWFAAARRARAGGRAIAIA